MTNERIKKVQKLMGVRVANSKQGAPFVGLNVGG